MIAFTSRVNGAAEETDIVIRWADTGLEVVCTSESAGKRRFTPAVFKALQRRLVDIAAAPSLDVMRALPGKCHQLTGDRTSQFAVHLDGQYRLVFEPDHQPIPIDTSGGIDWREVNKVVILEVVNYHGH
jgi:proteic killer suppression protein